MPGTAQTPNAHHGTQTQGIQQLLAAEKKAKEKVTEARKRKIKRIKEATEEAHAEIEAYRSEREKNYQEFAERNMGTEEDILAQIEQDTANYLSRISRTVKKNKDKVIDDLVDLVMDIKPEVHPNFFILKSFNGI